MVSDGSKIITVDYSPNKLFGYNFSDPWDVTTLSYGGVDIDISGEANYPSGLETNGETLIVGDGDNLLQYSMSTPWDLTTLAYDGVDVSIDSFFANQIASDGNTLIAGDGGEIRQYKFGTQWELNTLQGPTEVVDVSGQIESIADIFSDGEILLMAARNANGREVIEQFTFEKSWDASTLTYSDLRLYLVNTDIDNPEHIISSGRELLIANAGGDLHSFSYGQRLGLPRK